MDKPEVLKRLILKGYAERYGVKVFVETGTYKGDTVKAMVVTYLFDAIHSIEIDEERHHAAVRRFKGCKPVVRCWLGDSAVVLPKILETFNQPALFWLDAHHSTKQINHSNGLLITPLMAELDLVLAHRHDHVILIDDARYLECFAEKYRNFPSVEDVQQKVEAAGMTFEIMGDIVRCTPCAS